MSFYLIRSVTTAGLILGLFSAATAWAGSITYNYDDLGRLIQLTYGDGTTITYTYDKVGNRATRTVTAN